MSILLILFQKNFGKQNKFWLCWFPLWFFYSLFHLFSILVFILSSLLPAWSLVCSSLSRLWRWKVWLLIWALSPFLTQAFTIINFLLGTAFTISYIFCILCFCFLKASQSIFLFLLWFLLWSFDYLWVCHLIFKYLWFSQIFTYHWFFKISFHLFVQHTLYDLSIKFTEVCFLAYNIVYFGECLTCTWEKRAFCFSVECSMDIR